MFLPARDAFPVETRRPYRMNRRPEERVKVLGGEMDLVRPEEVFHFVAGRIAGGKGAIVANHNLHSLYLLQKDPQVVDFFKAAELIEVDSVPLIFWARIVGRASRRFHRCTYLDWRNDFWARATKENWKVFFVGGAPGVADAALENIRRDWPNARVESHQGYFDVTDGSAENEAVVAKIKAYKPDILFVGMGMPRQEKWLLENHKKLDPCVGFTVGGAFDYEAGVQLAAPRWMGQVGMEWLFRLMADPERLFTRYCVEPWHLFGPAMVDARNALARQLKPGKKKNLVPPEAAYRRATDLALKP